MKKVSLVLTILSAILIATGCVKQEKDASINSANEDGVITAVPEKAEENSSFDDEVDDDEASILEKKVEYSPMFELVEREYLGSIARSTVNDDNVNVRLMPSLSSEKIGTVNKGDVVEIIGYSNSKETISGYDGYWLKITFNEKPREYYGLYGWVFSEFVDVDPSVDVSTFTAGKVEDGRLKTIEIDRNGIKTESKVYLTRLTNDSAYTFVWSDDMQDFKYNDPTGVFKWNPDTNGIENITNMGSEMESAWCKVSDDMKFMFQDYGTSPGVRGLGIYDVKTTKQIFSGSYYHELDYDGESVIIAKVFDIKTADENVRKFTAETPLTEEQLDWVSQGLSVDVVVKYRYNLFNKKKEFAGCEYVFSQ